jgi:hypothetical protein
MKTRIGVFLFLLLLGVGNISGKNLTQIYSKSPSNFELLDIEIQFSKMIIPAGLGGAVLYDISDPENPTESGRFRVGEFLYARTYNWDLTNKIAIGTGREAGMAIYDIRNNSQPQKLLVYNPNAVNVPGSSGTISFEDVEIYDGYAFLASHSNGLMIYDISEPSQPEFVSLLPTENAVSLAIKSDIVYLADGDGGLKIIDIVNRENPRLLSSHQTSGSTRDVRYSNGHVFLAAGAAGVDVFNVNNDQDVFFVTNHPTDGFASRVAVAGNRVSASAWTRLEVFEWNGSTLELIGYKNTGGRVMAVGAPSIGIIYSAEWEKLRIYKYGTVEGPDIDLSTRALDFPQLENGQADTLELHIENNGTAPLNVLAYGFTSAEYSAYPQETEFNPGERKTVNIIYSPTSNRGIGSLEIVSNDSDEGSVIVKLEGNSAYNAVVGKEAPNFQLNAVANETGTITLDRYKGQIVVLALFATW